MVELGRAAVAAGRVVARSSSAVRDDALRFAADLLEERSGPILAANATDLERATGAGADATSLDRLRLDAGRITGMASGLRDVAALSDPVGEVVDGWVRPNGLRVERVRIPLVLHGASSVVPKYVDMINQFGGKLDNAVGIPEAQLRKAATSAVCKINIDSDGRLAMTAAIRKAFAENPKEFDPRKYLGPARDELKTLIIEKNKNVLGSAGHGKAIFG